MTFSLPKEKEISSLAELTPPSGWKNFNEARIAPVQQEKLGFRQRLLIGKMLRGNTAYCPNLFLTMLHNLRVFAGFLKFNLTVMPNGHLPRQLTELAILRVGWKTCCRYEWGQHVDIGLRVGLSIQQIARVPLGGNAEGWNETEKHVLDAVDQLIDEHAISQTTWDGLLNHFAEDLIIELMLLVGSYTALAGALNSAGVELEPEIEKVLSKPMGSFFCTTDN